jgi:outer membrane lipoprotein-sorting protein
MLIPSIPCFAVVLVAALQAPTKPTALEALVGALAKAESLSAEVDLALHSRGNEDEHLTVRLCVRRPKLGRFEATGGAGGISGLLLPAFICDGSNLWVYNQRSKTYLATPLDAGTKPYPSKLPAGMALVMLAYFDAPAIAAGKSDPPWKASLDGATPSTADVDGEPCDVVRLKFQGEDITFSVATKTGLPRRVVEELLGGAVRITWDFTKVDPAAKLDEKTFQFTPPADATRVEAPASPSAAPLAVGDVAPDIGGPSPSAGRNLKLSDYRGKVVLVNFWFEH